MTKQYQVTLICKTGQYKPVSTIINFQQSSDEDLTAKAETKKQIQQSGIIKICQKRYWTNADLKKYGYTAVKVRVYDKDAIAAENAERYERIKQEKYASGEWKAPKPKK